MGFRAPAGALNPKTEKVVYIQRANCRKFSEICKPSFFEDLRNIDTPKANDAAGVQGDFDGPLSPGGSGIACRHAPTVILKIYYISKWIKCAIPGYDPSG